MKYFPFIICVLWSFIGIAQVLRINELDPDSPSTDTQEFIELKSDIPNTPTDGYILVFFNGSANGGDSSYLVIDLNGQTTDNNGLLVIGSAGVSPFPQLVISDNLFQNGADAVGIYAATIADFPDGTLATQTNLIDAWVYGTNDANNSELMALLGQDAQYNDNGTNANPKSIQRFVDAYGVETFESAKPTPRRENDGSGFAINPVRISVNDTAYNEGDTFEIIITAEDNFSSDVNFNISLDHYGFDASDYTGQLSLSILAGQNGTNTSISLIDDAEDEGDEVIKIRLVDLQEPMVPSNGNVEIRVVDNDFTTAAWGTPLSPTFGIVESTQPDGYYDSLNGLADMALREELQAIIANPNIVRAQTYADVIDILMEADQNPQNSNEVWLVYTETGRAKLDFQTSSNNIGTWNREHTYPRSRGGFYDIDADDVGDGIDIYWATKADSLRHGNSDAHALRAADASENSARNNKHYGDYLGPEGTLGKFRGDVARSVLYMATRYNGLEIVNGFSNTAGQLGDLATLLDWHRNDPPDDFEMNRNNVVYNWQYNRNPFIDQPLLVEYIWGNELGNAWATALGINNIDALQTHFYPNPSSSRIYFSGKELYTDIEVFSIQGAFIKRFNKVENYADLSLPSGTYILKLDTKIGTSFQKIIIN